MANFDLAYEKILQNEGRYSSDPNDPGGETYKGVSRCSWNSWKGWPYIDLNKLLPGFPANLEKELDLQAEVKQLLIKNETKDVVVYIPGVLSAILTQIFSFFFGSSLGSVEKNKMISDLYNKSNTDKPSI